jgi:predicted RNA polymerase sigma factor
MASGPHAALEIVDTLATDPALQQYHLVFAVRADLLTKVGRADEARAAFARAASMTRNARERELLTRRQRRTRSR